MEIFLLLALALVSTGLIWWGSSMLEGAANDLALHYGLPAIVQGSILVAIGSSMPELLTAVIAPLLHDEFELGVAVIIGSAIFNILVIPAVSTLASEGGLQAGRDVVYKEAQFYMLAVAAFLLMCSLAVIYYPVTETEGVISGLITVELALIPLAMYCLYIFIQYNETIEFDSNQLNHEVRVYRQWSLLVLGLIIIFVGVEGLIRMAVGFGEIFEMPSFIWGLTVIAAVTSFPDMFASISAARRDHDVTSIANVFGSNVFDLLVAVPAGVIIAGAATINFSRAVPLIAFLVVVTIALFTLMRTEFELQRWEAYTLIFLYVIFLVWVVLENVGTLDILI